VAVSANEWAASDSIAADPDRAPATAFATAMARLAAPATITVTTLSPPLSSLCVVARLRAVVDCSGMGPCFPVRAR
jgi:hypothetical protein